MDDDQGDRSQTLLVVVAGDPSAVGRWLAPETLSSVALFRAGAPELGVAGLPDAVRRSRDVHGSGWDLVRLPLDGPAGALGLAARSLRSRLGGTAARTAAVLESDPPPAPALLSIVAASLTPGVDLSGFGWATAERVCLTGRDGVATLHHDPTDHRRALELAGAVHALRLLSPGSPAQRWVDAVTAGTVAPTLRGWDHVLRAGYVEAAVAAVRPCNDDAGITNL